MADLNDVALFVQVVRAGSFAEAARRAGLPSNSVSRRIQVLEQQLGTRLMQRSTRRLSLTDAGQTLFAQCAEQVESLAEAARGVALGSQQPAGRLRVAVPSEFFNWFPIGLVAEFLAAHPAVRLEFVLNDARADLLGEGIDVAIRGGKDIEPQLIARRIGSSSAGLVASSAYLAKRGQPATPAALAQHDCIGTTSRPDGAMSWRLDGPDGEVHIAVRGRFGANSAHARLQGALAGLGIALLPHIMTNGPVQAGRLQVVLPGYGTDGAGLYLAYLSRRQLPLALSRFIDFMAPNLAAQGIVDG